MDQFITYLYSVFGTLVIGMYIPQIVAVLRDHEHARSISLVAWSTWTLSYVVSMLYAIMVLKDWPVFFISLLNCLGCLLVTIIAIYKRYKTQVPKNQ